MNNVFKQIIFWILKTAAKIQLLKIKPVIIGVGGSSGKTSLSSVITVILKEKYRVKNSSGKNSQTGIPLSILDIDPGNYTPIDWIRIVLECPLKLLINWQRYEYFIAEMGIDGPNEPNNMSYLLKILTPKIAVLTNITFEHSEYFENIVENMDLKTKAEKVLKLTAKQENLLLSSVPSRGEVIVNLDDKFIRKNIESIVANKTTVSIQNNKTDLYVSKVESSLSYFKTSIVYQDKNYLISIEKPLSEHYAASFALALAVCLKVEISIKEAISYLEKNFVLPPGRMSVFEGVKNTIIIDSSYNNATLPPILDILDFLDKNAEKKRKVAIIGDMRELGFMTKKLHEAVAAKIVKTVDLAILVGPSMQKYVAPILENKVKYKSYLTFTEVKKDILDLINPGDLILVKSSQNDLFLERMVEFLLEDKKNVKFLCRRSSIWDLKRAQTD
ncbi:MAG: Mur ligase family protein [Candidatus Levyibacteriota bacterium]